MRLLEPFAPHRDGLRSFQRRHGQSYLQSLENAFLTTASKVRRKIHKYDIKYAQVRPSSSSVGK